MIRDPKAYAKSQTKKQAAFDSKVADALEHLPSVLREKYDGILQARNRNDMRDMLIADGVLGSKWKAAKHIAHAKKHGTYLDPWHQRDADMIIDKMIESAVDMGLIDFSSGGDSFEIMLLAESDHDTANFNEFEEAYALDADDKHPLSQYLPPHIARSWQLDAAHE